MLRKVKPSVLHQMLDNEPLLLKIAKVMDKKFRTVEVWVRENNIMLTTATVMDLIKTYLKLSEDQILEKKVKDCAKDCASV